MTTTPAPSTADVLGVQLHEGSIVVDIKGGEHTIDHFGPYRGRFVGDHVRRAYNADETWCCTVADHEHFHCLPESAVEDAWAAVDAAGRAFATDMGEAA